MTNLIIGLTMLFSFSNVLSDNDPYTAQRRQMVITQIERRGVDDKATLNAMRLVKRHLFVRKSLIKRAYDDRPLPIGYGQTISQPYIVAYMTELIHPKPHHSVLEIGSGSGYQAAVLAGIVERVYTIEIIPQLGNSAKNRLSKLGYTNVEVKVADGYHGWEEHAPFDAIIVTAASEYIPPPLIKQLKDGGRMVIPVGSPFMVQTLMLVEKKGDKVTTTGLMPVRFVPFRRSD
ncbi:MAG: protein-L-isoaspartate(D-aspartate) O-methyltransferase [Thermodesulfobacteriota bacterium]|nr:protein-L-isoaspartate(D-aspartate) O-methyltransferase [Thermodesulfobacteriota bacterium]